MTIEALEGRAFAGRPFRLCAEKVGEFVTATGDDPDRWVAAAPPGFAASLLFVVAPAFLEDPLVEGAVIHGEQTFEWHRPLLPETQTTVTGTVDRVRLRGEIAFVTFSLEVADGDGILVAGKSTFLVGDGAAATSSDERSVPPPFERAASLPVDDRLPAPRSASRADLIRYAAATRDWNPIHWDHGSALAAGLGGVVVHGLLQAAWLTQVAAAMRPRSQRPVRAARIKFKSPLRPGEAAVIDGAAEGDACDLTLSVDDSVTVSGRFMMEP